ncbi:hypothetical protein ACTFIR_009670 [Dictyostelium discoideum]
MEKSSYLIYQDGDMARQNKKYGLFIITRKGDKIYSQQVNPKEMVYNINKYCTLPNPVYFKIESNTFEIKCRSHDPIKEVDFKMGEIEYVEPNKSATRVSAKDSFCIVNMQKNPKLYLYFNFCNPKELIDNKIKIENSK